MHSIFINPYSVVNLAIKAVVGNNISISINASSKEEADKIFTGLSDGGKVTMPMANTFWGDYFGMCTDKDDKGILSTFAGSCKGHLP